MNDTRASVAFIGLGLMGAHMAGHTHADDHDNWARANFNLETRA